jgi:methylmalonyl-CoA mutase cobalamin-binding subunit
MKRKRIARDDKRDGGPRLFDVPSSRWTDMTADRKIHAAGVSGVADAEVARLAARVISVLLSQKGALAPSDERRLALLGDAFMSEREEPRRAIMARMRQEGVSTREIIDIVLPEIARQAGRRWMDDEISFADVTIVTARLQETVRALGRVPRGGHETRNTAETALAKARARVLLIIPRPEEHTLGAFVLADQIRRYGCEVDVAMDQHPRQFAEKVRKTRYNMVGITASGRRSLASARELVEIIKTSVTRVTPVVLGGSVVGGGKDLKAMTGVDHVVQDGPSALIACGLMDENEDAAHGAP